MDIEDDTTVFATLKSFKSFISLPETSQNLEPASSKIDLQKQFTQRLELEEAAQKVQSKTHLLQVTQEKKQMELSHKRARIELEKVAHLSARDLEREVGRSQDLLARLRRLEEKEAQTGAALKEQQESNHSLQRSIESLHKKVEEKEAQFSETNQTMSGLRDELRDLNLRLQTQEASLLTQTTENQGLQEQLELQRKKYQEISLRCQSLQADQSENSDNELKIKALERRLATQEQDFVIVKNMKTEVARVPEMERELKRLREENCYLRETRENSSLVKEEAEGLKRKLERAEKIREELVNMELEKEKVVMKLQAWENLAQATGLNIRSPEDLSSEVIQIQQKELSLKQQNYSLTSSVRSLERSKAQLQGEVAQLRSTCLEEQKRRDTQDCLVRRLQKRLLLLTKERDGIRAILESYDSELSPCDYSPQLSRRVKEAEDMLQKIQAHNSDMEGQLSKAQEEAGASKLKAQTVEMELDVLKKQQASVAEGNPLATAEEVSSLRLKIEELESERQCLEEQNNVLQMRLERHDLQGDYDPVKTKVLHFTVNPVSQARQQRSEETAQLQEELRRLREHVLSLQTGGAVAGEGSFSLPPSQEVIELRRQMQSAELRNQRLKEVFQKKIQEFRTVCYLLTGYQMDITTENQYRLTSVYAEHMEDCLLFKASGPVGTGSMQLMETDFSRTLTDMVDLHLVHQKSIPAFLSAVTLDLFSRQTTI